MDQNNNNLLFLTASVSQPGSSSNEDQAGLLSAGFTHESVPAGVSAGGWLVEDGFGLCNWTSAWACSQNCGGIREREREGEGAQWPLELWSLSPYPHGQARPAQMQGWGGRQADRSPRGRSCTVRVRRLSLQGRVDLALCPQSALQATLGTCAHSPAPLPSLRLSLLRTLVHIAVHAWNTSFTSSEPPSLLTGPTLIQPAGRVWTITSSGKLPQLPSAWASPCYFPTESKIYISFPELGRILLTYLLENGVFHVSPLECKLNEGSVPVGFGPSSSDNTWCTRAP